QHYGARIWRSSVENETGNAIHGDWEKRSNDPVGRTECDPECKAPFVRASIAVKAPVRTPRVSNGFPEREFFAFCLAHCRGEVAGADNSVSIASITARVEIWFIVRRGCFGTNSVNGDGDAPCRIRAGLSRGRQ